MTPKNAPSMAPATDFLNKVTLIPELAAALMCSAHHQVRGSVAKLQHGQFNAIGRAPAHGSPEKLPVAEDFVSQKRFEIGDRMADAALLDAGGNDVNRSEAL